LALLQSLVIGFGERKDVNPKCFPYVASEAHVQRLERLGGEELPPERQVYGVMLHQLKYDKHSNELLVLTTPVPILVDADEPKDILNGKAWKDLVQHQ